MSFTKGVVSKGSAPTVDNDSTEGFYVGFRWIDTSTSTPTIYACVDTSVGAAIWIGFNLQDIYNLSNTNPQILTNSTKGAFKIKRGSDDDTDDVFETQNGAGTTKFSITGEGIAQAIQYNDAIGVTIAGASALPVINDGGKNNVSGSATISSINSLGSPVGKIKCLRFTGASTLVNSALDIILPGGANYTTANGDVFTFQEFATGDWFCISYALISGKPIVAGDLADLSYLASYANDAAAGVGGISVGFAYINSSTGAVHRRLS